MKQHKKLLEGLLLEESFELLKKEMSAMDSIARVEHFKEYAALYVSVKIFNEYAGNNLLPYVTGFVSMVESEEIFENVKDRLNIFIPQATIDMFFAGCIIAKKMDLIKYLIKFANKDLSQYPNSVKAVIDDNATEVLKYLVSHMQNTHYNNDILLSKVSDLGNEFLSFMIEERGFNVNAISDITNTNLITYTAYQNRLDILAFIIQTYSEQIDWRQIVPEYVDEEQLKRGYVAKEAPLMNLCLSIFHENSDKLMLNFYKVLLNEDVSTSASEINTLLVYATKNMATFTSQEGLNVLQRLFKHRNFKIEEYEETVSLIYGLAAMFLSVGIMKANVKALDEILKFTKVYLQNRDKNTVIPNANEYHALGSGLYVHQYLKNKIENIPASKREEITQYTASFVSLFIDAFSEDVNLVNPNGVMPMQQVSPNDREFTQMLTYGGIVVEEEPGLFGSMINRLKNKTIRTANEIIRMEAERRAINSRHNSRNKKKDDIRQDIEKMAEIFASKFNKFIRRAEKENSAPVVIDVLREFDKKTQNVLGLMVRQQFFEVNDELRWLRGSFMSNLEESVESYWRLMDIARNTASGEELQEKIVSAQDRVLINLQTIQRQLNISLKNIASEIEFAASNEMNLGGKIIKENFDISENTLNERMIRSHEREEKGEDKSYDGTVFDGSVDIMSHTSDKQEKATDKSNNKEEKVVKTAVDNLFG